MLDIKRQEFTIIKQNSPKRIGLRKILKVCFNLRSFTATTMVSMYLLYSHADLLRSEKNSENVGKSFFGRGRKMSYGKASKMKTEYHYKYFIELKFSEVLKIKMNESKSVERNEL